MDKAFFILTLILQGPDGVVTTQNEPDLRVISGEKCREKTKTYVRDELEMRPVGSMFEGSKVLGVDADCFYIDEAKFSTIIGTFTQTP